MSVQLKLDEMLEALGTLDQPRAQRWQSILEAVGTSLAQDLAAILECETDAATFQGMAFGGLCAPFRPTYRDQVFPECFVGLDDGGPEEWELEAESIPGPCATCAAATETRAFPCDECGADDSDDDAGACGQCDGTGELP